MPCLGGEQWVSLMAANPDPSRNRHGPDNAVTSAVVMVPPSGRYPHRPNLEKVRRMNPVKRVIGLAGVVAALLASLTAGTVAAASPTVGHVYVNNNIGRPEHDRRRSIGTPTAR